MIQANSNDDRPLLSILWARRIVIAATLVVGVLLAVVVLRFFKPTYVASAHVLLVSSDSKDASSASGDMPTIATSSIVLQRAAQQLHLSASLPALKKGIIAHVAPHSSLMQVSFKSTDSQEAIRVANAVADQFVSYYASISGLRYHQVIGQLAQDMQAAKNRVDLLQGQLEHDASQRSFDGTDKSLDDVAAKLSDLQSQRGLANASLLGDYGALAGLQADSKDAAPADRHTLLENDPYFRNLESDVARDAASLAAMRAEYTENMPGLAGLEDKVQNEQTALADAAQTLVKSPHAYSASALDRVSQIRKTAAVVAGDRARVDSIDEQIASAHQALMGAPGNTESLGALRAERDAANEEYQALALRLADAQGSRAEANALGAAIVVNYAVDANQGLAGPRTLIVLAAVAILLAAFGAGYLVEMLDPRLHSRERVEGLYGQPVIATLGAASQKGTS